MGASRENAFTNVRATRRAAPRWPELNAGCHSTCASGKSTSKPAWRSNSSASAAASGNSRSPRRHEELDALHPRDSDPVAVSPLERAPPPSRAATPCTSSARTSTSSARSSGAVRCPPSSGTAATARPAWSRPPPAITVPPQRGRRSDSALPRPSTFRRASRTKLAKLSAFTAELVETGADLDEAKAEAVAYAQRAGLPSSRTAPSRAARRLRRDRRRDPRPAGRGRRPSSCPWATGRCSRASAAHSEPVPARRSASASSRQALPVMASSWRAGRAVESGSATRSPTGSRSTWPSRRRRLAAGGGGRHARSHRRGDRGGRRRLRRRRHPERKQPLLQPWRRCPGIEAAGPVVLVVTGRNIDDELLARCRHSLLQGLSLGHVRSRRATAAGRCARAGSRA